MLSQKNQTARLSSKLCGYVLSLCLLICIYIPSPSFAQITLYEHHIEQTQGLAVLHQARIFTTSDHQQSLEQLLALKPTFTPVKVINDTLDLRLTQSSYWLQLDLDNQSTQTQWFIETSGSLSRNITLYVGELQTNNTTSPSDYQKQTILPHARFIKYALHLAPQKQYRLYFHIRDRQAPLIIDTRLYASQPFLEKIMLFYPLYSTVVGGLLTLALYNLLYFFYLRDSSFLALSILIIGFVIELGSHSGFWYYFPFTRYYFSFIGNSAAFITIAAAVYIGCNWLSLQKYLPKAAYLARTIIGICLILIPIHLYWGYGTSFAGLLALSLMIIFLVIIVIRYRQGFRFNISQQVAVALVCLAFIPTLLRGAGLIDNVPLLTDSMYFILLLALILLSLTQAEQVRIKTENAERIAATTQAKDEFLTTMSHELRTPMNAVVNAGRLLQRTPLNNTQNNYVARLNISSQHMLALINDILDLARLDSHLLQLESIPFCLKDDVLIPVEQLLQEHAHKKQLRLIIDNQSQLSTQQLLGDPTRLRQILINLLNNAIKFTEEGEIRLSIHKQIPTDNRYNEQHYHLQFVISDTGIGISPEQQEKLFKPFSQADSSISRQYGGSGLGLAICQKLVQNMGGSLTLESAVNQGSRFFFTIAFTQQQTSAALSTNTNDPIEKTSASLDNCRILLVDDDEMNRFFGRELIASLGVNIDVADSGEQALAKLRSQTFDLVFMDVSMPTMDGYETTRRIRHDLQQTHLPVIALTAHAIAGERERCLQAGMNDYLTKPFEIVQLEQAIQNTLS